MFEKWNNRSNINEGYIWDTRMLEEAGIAGNTYELSFLTRKKEKCLP